MWIEFRNPLLLLSIPLLAIFLYLVMRHTRLHFLTVWGRSSSLTLRLVVGTLIVLAICGMAALYPERRLAMVVLVDLSSSMPERAAADFTLHLAELETEISRKGIPATVKLVGFDEQPFLMTAAEIEQRLGTSATGNTTDIQRALQFARNLVEPAADNRFLLFSDGNETRGVAEAETAELRRAGVLLSTMPLQPSQDGEVLIESLQTPVELFSDQEFAFGISIESRAQTKANLQVQLSDFTLLERSLDLKIGTNEFKLESRLRLPPGDAFLSVRVDSPGDRIPVNNGWHQAIAVRPAPRAIYVERTSDQAQPLARALSQMKIPVTILNPDALPVRIEDLDPWQILILGDVPASAFQPNQIGAMVDFVSRGGGTLLALGGTDSLGPGGYIGTQLEQILPVKLKPDDDHNVALVLAIDQSGSMQGNKIELAKDAAKKALLSLDEKDLAGVVGYNNAHEWIVPLQRATKRAEFESAISRITAEGGTNLYPVLEDAHQALKAVEAKTKHVIVLSDGKSPQMDYQRLLQLMTDRDRITLSTIAIGSEADSKTLSNLARWGKGRFYPVPDVESVPRIVAEETGKASRDYLIEEPFRPLLLEPRSSLSSIDFASGPPLLGYVATGFRKTAQNIMTTPRDQPLLSFWRYGLGKVFVFTSDAKPRWAAEWLGWESFSRFWSQLVFDGASGRIDSQVSVRVHSLEGKTRITVTLAQELPDAGGLRGLEARLRSREGESSLILEPEGPGLFGALVELPEGAYLLQLPQREGKSVSPRPFTVRYGEEHRRLHRNDGLLRKLSEDSGGLFDAAAAQILSQANPSPGLDSRPLGHWLLALAIGLYLAALFHRRRLTRSSHPPQIQEEAPGITAHQG